MTERTDAAAANEPSDQPAPSRQGRRWFAVVDDRDRSEIFTDAATAATDAGPAYWLVLALAGAIAALGLALNSSAVIIGAMLIAPLLAPVVGLALALAMGDGRLAVETALIVFTSTLAVVVVGALLAIALPVPFQTVTAEIAARTRPTTLDLVIAVFSGLAGAVVTVARRSRLSGAVPGVAVAVALVPPLAVTGYGIGTGWNWAIIRGSLLLYGANLAGIVMSGMAVFLVAGMHRALVRRADAAWHASAPSNAFTIWVERIPGIRSLGMMRSLWTRIALVVGFVGLVALPLRESLRQIARESRVQRAVADAVRLFSVPGRSFVVSRDVELGPSATHVVLNVATTAWYGDSARRAFEIRASAAAGEPISLELDQLPASGGDLSAFAALLSTSRPAAAPSPAPPTPTPAARAAVLRGQVADALQALSLPDSIAIVGFDLVIGDSAAGDALRLRYAGPDSVSPQVIQLLTKELQRTLAEPRLVVEAHLVSTVARGVRVSDRALLDSVATLLRRAPRLGVDLLAGRGARGADVDSIAGYLRRAGAGLDSTRLAVVAAPDRQGIALRLRIR